MIIERPISKDNATEQLRRLYETAFPREEQIPWDDLMQLIDTMPLDFTAYYDGDALMGFTIVYPRKSFNWFWYFAVPEPLRGKGVGQTILSQLITKYKQCNNILDMEDPKQVCENQAVRRRRHDFYSRNGFSDTGVGRSFGDIDFTIMKMGDRQFTMQDYDDIIAELRSYWDNMPKPQE